MFGSMLRGKIMKKENVCVRERNTEKKNENVRSMKQEIAVGSKIPKRRECKVKISGRRLQRAVQG